MGLLLDPGSFREYGAFVEHTCTDFGMDSPKNKVPNEQGTVGGIEIILYLCGGIQNTLV